MSERDTAGNRRLAAYQDDVDEDDDDDRPNHLRADRDDAGDVGGADVQCSECESKAAFEDPAAALGNPDLPSHPLCRGHILDRK